MKQIACVVEHCAGAVDGVFRRREGLAEFHLTKVVHERLDRREQDRLGIAEQAFVMFELVELVGERLDLLHWLLIISTYFAISCAVFRID